MMNKKRMPHIITVVSFLVFIVLGLACASMPRNPMTKKVKHDAEENNLSMDGFRFLVSTDVTLTLVTRELTIDRSATTVQEKIVRNIIKLKATTTGRWLDGDVDTGLNIYFEKNNDGTTPTLTFVEKPNQKGDEKYFFFKYENHPKLKTVVKYDGYEYEVTWTGKEEPYLLYQNTTNVKTNQRKMRGVN